MTATTQVRERPILFSDAMVRAILDGRKTQTRRVARPQPTGEAARICAEAYAWTFGGRGEAFGLTAGDHHYEETGLRCPYGRPGDRLWVREAWAFPGEEEVIYRADPEAAALVERWRQNPAYPQVKWRPSIHMPRWASRITLEITDVRVERVQEIGDLSDRAWHDLKAEGWDTRAPHRVLPVGCINERYEAAEWFRALWDEINGPRGYGWDANPWVWAITFKRVED